jgi:branched-chain amino acid transport system permease protein
VALQGAAAGLTRTMGGDVLPPLLVTFGLAVTTQNGFSTSAQKLPSSALETASLEFGALHPGLLPLLTLAVAVGLILGLEWLFSATRLGRAFRATSDDPEMARVIGVKTPQVFALAMALSLPWPGCFWRCARTSTRFPVPPG